MTLIVIITYFLLLLGVSRLATSRSNNNVFFRGERKSPWYMVAFGMVGASISGVTFVSVPGMVTHSGFSYLMVCAGFIPGYIIVAYLLLPYYYRHGVTSIYTILKPLGQSAYKTGASFFLLSKLLGTGAKFFVPCYIISLMLGWHISLTILMLFALVWLYTRRGGIKTLVWTDSLQTICMLAALLIILGGLVELVGLVELEILEILEKLELLAIPIWRAISRAVRALSPVTIFTSMPARRQSATAAGTSARTGSLMATIA